MNDRLEVTMKRFWRDRSLGIVLAILFLVAWALQAWTDWQEFQAEQREHRRSIRKGRIHLGLRPTNSGKLAVKFLQLFAFAVLTSFLVFRGSPESRDDKDETMAALSRIEERLDRLGNRDALAND
jgi:hypothetical protein